MKITSKTLIIEVKERPVMYILRIITYVLVIVGALNWGLVGIFDFNLVDTVFGEMSILSRIIYALVGISAAVLLFSNRKIFTCESI